MNFKKISDEVLHSKLTEFKEKIKSQSDIADDFDEILLLRYIKYFNGNIEKALKRLRSSIEIRNSYSNIFLKRDTQEPRLRKLIEQVEMFWMPKLTADNNRILIIKLIDFNPQNVILDDGLSVFSMLYDTSYINPDDMSTNKLADGEIIIFDLNGLTPRHLMRISFSSIRCFFRYMYEAHPLRINQIHVINCSSTLDKLMLLIRPFISSYAMKVTYFHRPDSTTLFNYLPRELLPIELQGTGGSLDGPKLYWIRKTDENREYLLNDEQWIQKDNFSNTITEEEEEILNDESFYMGFC